MIIFIVQPNRQKETLKADADLIAKCLLAAKAGDSIQALTTSNKPILTFEMTEGLDRLEQKRLRLAARSQLVKSFKKGFENPPAFDAPVDVAAALSVAMDRFNFSRSHAKRILVLMSDGLQHTKQFSWREGVPSDSWCVHANSEFAAVPPNADEKPLAVIMLTTHQGYVEQPHGELIKRWYALFFHIKKLRFLAFTVDHLAVKSLLFSGGSSKPIPAPDEVNLDGPLSFTPYE